LQAIHTNKVNLILSQNIGCRLHFANGTAVPVMHPIELMAQFLNDT